MAEWRVSMSVKSKRIAKKVAKTGVSAIGDVVFLILKAIGTAALIAVTTGLIFSCFFLIYLRTNLTTDLDVDPADFKMSLSSVICCLDPETGQEIELVTLQSTQFRRWVDFEEIPEYLVNALVAIEDHRFFSHQGVDWYRTVGAFMNMFLGMRDTFGGSTITQQLIKNLTNDDDATVQRKLQEIFRALEYERQHSKEDILELYLNLVYFGHGCYGIGAAANYYFDKEVSDLSLAESAAIIGITNNPSKFSPYADRAANKERQETILFRMLELGYIKSEQDYQRAVSARLNFKRGENAGYEQVVYTWFEEAVIKDVIADLRSMKDMSESAAVLKLYNGGLRIIATIDLDMQAIVDNIYQHPEMLPDVTGSSQPLQSGIIVADPYTGEIKALSGGVGNKTRNMLLNRATMTRRPPGSSLKPISVYSPAIEYGLISPDSKLYDSEDTTLTGTTWMPRNADRSYVGLTTIRNAIRLSLNTIPAIVLDKLTPAASFRFMRDVLGFDLNPADEDYAPLAAGQLTYGATVREMASAFTMFPNSGERTVLRTYSRVYDNNGDILIDNKPSYIRAISEATAYAMTDMLHNAVTSGTGSAANLGNSMPTAGKTGTSTDTKDRWFVGFTPYYIAAVWTGFDTPATMRSSANPAAQIWKMIMAPIHEGLETGSFDIPDNSYIRPVQGVATAYMTVRCVDAYGEILQEEATEQVVNRDISATAPLIDGYLLIGNPQETITITNDSARNIIIFLYSIEQAEDEEDTDNPGDNENTDNPGGQVDPGVPYDPFDPFNPYTPFNPFDPDDPNNPYNPNNPNYPYNTPDPGDSGSPATYYPPDPGDIIDTDGQNEPPAEPDETAEPAPEDLNAIIN